MNINVTMVTKNRTIKKLEVDSTKDSFKFNKGLYIIRKEAVNFFWDPKKEVRVYPELIYMEGRPSPVNADRDSSHFLNAVVLKNALEQTSDQKSELFSIVGDYARNPSKIMMLVFALIILIAFLGGL